MVWPVSYTHLDVYKRQVYESVALLSEYPEYRPVHRALTERQIMLYRALIEIGAGTGEFVLASPPGMIARNLVALEDLSLIHI